MRGLSPPVPKASCALSPPLVVIRRVPIPQPSASEQSAHFPRYGGHSAEQNSIFRTVYEHIRPIPTGSPVTKIPWEQLPTSTFRWGHWTAQRNKERSWGRMMLHSACKCRMSQLVALTLVLTLLLSVSGFSLAFAADDFSPDPGFLLIRGQLTDNSGAGDCQPDRQHESLHTGRSHRHRSRVHCRGSDG